MAMLDLEPAATELTGLLGAVTDDQLVSPTPCENTSVGALLDHLMSLSLAFTWAAQKRGPDGARADRARDRAQHSVLSAHAGEADGLHRALEERCGAAGSEGSRT